MRTSVSFLVAVSLGLGCSVVRADDGKAAQKVKQIIAHRGASAERPECTLLAIQRAVDVGATAVELDVRTSRDGRLFILHDVTLDRTTNGMGPANAHTLDELQRFDAGSWFDPKYQKARIPSLIEAAEACRGKIDLLLDLKEQGDVYDRRVVTVIQQHGDAARTIVGVRSVAQAERFRKLLPRSRQLALIPTGEAVEDFARAGVDTIRLWPRWLQEGDDLVRRVRATGKKLHLNGTLGELEETISLLKFSPDSLSSDHPGRLKKSLARITRGETPDKQLQNLIETRTPVRLEAGETRVDEKTFLNRDYQMQDVPTPLSGLPRYRFAGGEGDQVRLRFRAPTVVFAAFEYNASGQWSFVDRRSPGDFGWQLWRPRAYLGSSNSRENGGMHRASIWYREFQAGQELVNLPRWWVCLGITNLEQAKGIEGFKAGLTFTGPAPQRDWDQAALAARVRPLAVPPFATSEAFRDWQTQQRKRFVARFLYPYQGQVLISRVANSAQATHWRQEYRVTLDGQRLFRFFRLVPRRVNQAERLPTIVCFMGHGKVSQILDEADSYQHACAKQFVDAGYLVYAMENVGMGPGQDLHRDLDQALRLEGHGWYSLLFAHQRYLLDHVLADDLVDQRRVGTTGVSTGGLLALSAAAMEPKIAAASVQGIFGSMRVSFIRDRQRHCTCGAIPGLLPEFDLPELALLIAPRALHVANGKSDGFSPREARRALALLAPLYQRAGGSRPFMTVSSGGHEFVYEPAAEFFREVLDAPAERAGPRQK